MKNLVLISVLLFTSLTSLAQENKTQNDSLLVHGIQFQLPSILTINNFDGYIFAYRYRINKALGFRFGLTTNIKNNNDDKSELRDTLLTKTFTINENYFIKLSAQYIRSVMSYNDFSFIVGGGPSISYQRVLNIIKHSRQNNFDRTENLSASYGIGADFLAGIEYQLYDNIVISGEYGLSITWLKTNHESSLHQSNFFSIKTSGKKNIFNLNRKRVILGITIYF